PAFAQEVQLEVSFLNTGKTKDYLYYDKSKPLLIADFKGKPRQSSQGVASTNSGILMEMKSETDHDKMLVIVDLSVYFDQRKSWMKKEGRNPKVLAHEQVHMDITAIHACLLAQKLKQIKLHPNKAFAQLKTAYQKQMKELNEMQNQYDHETRHGIDEQQQAKWEKFIHQRQNLVHQSCLNLKQ